MAGFPPVNWLEWAGELIGITIVVVGLMIASIIYLMSNSLFTVTRFGTNYLNRVFSYQVTTLALSLVIILIIALLTRFQSLRLLSVTRIDGEVHPEPWIGISTRNKDTWKTLGWNMAIVISIVTAIAIYFQVYRNGVIQSLTLGSFLLILIYALTNSFVEETTFRHTFASIVSPYLRKCPLSGHTRKDTRGVVGGVSRLVPFKKHP